LYLLHKNDRALIVEKIQKIVYNGCHVCFPQRRGEAIAEARRVKAGAPPPEPHNSVVTQEETMRNGNLEQQTAEEAIARVPEAAAVLRSYRIDPTNRMSLATAAAAVSMAPDALMAEIEEKLRRAARRRVAVPQDEVLQERAVGA
jgi:hypothetical protein